MHCAYQVAPTAPICPACRSGPTTQCADFRCGPIPPVHPHRPVRPIRFDPGIPSIGSTMAALSLLSLSNSTMLSSTVVYNTDVSINTGDGDGMGYYDDANEGNVYNFANFQIAGSSSAAASTAAWSAGPAQGYYHHHNHHHHHHNPVTQPVQQQTHGQDWEIVPAHRGRSHDHGHASTQEQREPSSSRGRRHERGPSRYDVQYGSASSAGSVGSSTMPAASICGSGGGTPIPASWNMHHGSASTTTGARKRDKRKQEEDHQPDSDYPRATRSGRHKRIRGHGPANHTANFMDPLLFDDSSAVSSRANEVTSHMFGYEVLPTSPPVDYRTLPALDPSSAFCRCGHPYNQCLCAHAGPTSHPRQM